MKGKEGKDLDNKGNEDLEERIIKDETWDMITWGVREEGKGGRLWLCLTM